MTQIKGIKLSGDEVAILEDKHFTIISEPKYEEFDDLNNAGKKKDKMVIEVELVNGTQADWLINMTSQKKILAEKGRDLSQWIGYQGEFVVKEEDIFGVKKNVIYLK